MLSKFTFFVATLAFSFLPFASANADDEVDLSVLQSMGYEATGVSKRCVSHSRIRRTEIIDNTTILFHMTGRKSYANILPRKCNGLNKRRGIKYQVRGGTLCNVDIVEVLTTSNSGARCGLGDFYEIEKIEVDGGQNATPSSTPVEDNVQ